MDPLYIYIIYIIDTAYAIDTVYAIIDTIYAIIDTVYVLNKPCQRTRVIAWSKCHLTTTIKQTSICLDMLNGTVRSEFPLLITSHTMTIEHERALFFSDTVQTSIPISTWTKLISLSKNPHLRSARVVTRIELRFTLVSVLSHIVQTSICLATLECPTLNRTFYDTYLW